MKKHIKTAIVFILLALGAISCKSSSCGCGSYGELNNTSNQVEQRA